MLNESKWKAMAEMGTILRCLVGSEAYGLATPPKSQGACLIKVGSTRVCENGTLACSISHPMVGSDRDEKGVCVEPFETYCTLSGKFDQFEYRSAAERTGIRDAKSEPGDLDLTIYGLEKFLRLATYGNPNIVELLFITGDSVLEATQMGADLRALYPFIISRQAGRRYLGYMEAQKQRLLGERGQMRVTRTDLIEAHGYDTKYASHVLRLGFQGEELLETGRLVLPLSGAIRDVLMDVKAGKYGLDEVLQMAGDLEQKVKDLVKDGPLRDTPDMLTVENWMRNAYSQAWKVNRDAYVELPSLTVH